MTGEEHNRAYRAALNEVGEQFGGWRCEVPGCDAHGGEMGTVMWGGEPRIARVVCQKHWDAWYGHDSNRLIRTNRRRYLALSWGWGLDAETEAYLASDLTSSGQIR